MYMVIIYMVDKGDPFPSVSRKVPLDVSILSDLSSWVAWQLYQLVVAFACAVLHMLKISLCERV